MQILAVSPRDGGKKKSLRHPEKKGRKSNSFEELEASGSSSTTLHGSPETLAHSSPLQPLSHIRNIEDLRAGEVSWFPQAKTWGLNVDEIRMLYRDKLERVHDCLECGVMLHSHKALVEHEKLDDHVQEKERIDKFFNSKAKSLCPICGAKAQNKTKLRNHVIRHFHWTFGCKECTKLFCSIRNYRDHRHPPITNEIKYACECGCTFVEQRNLRLHKSSSIHKKRMAFIYPQGAEPIAEPETVGDLMSLIADESFPDLFE
ncbi:zinc finger protein weckle-like [Drosophila suzukii]|uniref:Zinc finger protein weckle-like n=1 Tax=Drosophila suzukii TaxID=28584 RepID=A0ABM4TL85_DROSZ